MFSLIFHIRKQNFGEVKQFGYGFPKVTEWELKPKHQSYAFNHHYPHLVEGKDVVFL